MSAVEENTKNVDRRHPQQVMRLQRLGCAHQSRLSFMRILLRRLKRERWSFSREAFDVNSDGVGHAILTARGPVRSYSLVAFFHQLAAENRSDRVIAEAWDATFTLFDGVPDADDIKRLSANVPRQEAGRVSHRELSLSRANRSARLWQHVVTSLARGVQPDPVKIASVGYLMRTTAVYGSGKFGAADREDIADRAEFSAPFQVEMLTVYLIRTLVRDLLQHQATAQGGSAAVLLDPTIARAIGIGNSTGLGMAPFVLNHPVLINNWVMAREEAIARVRSLRYASPSEIEFFTEILARSNDSIASWTSDHPLQQKKIATLQDDIAQLNHYLLNNPLTGYQPWNRLYCRAEQTMSVEGQEFLASLMLEPYGELVDGLVECLSDNSGPDAIDGAMSLSELQSLIQTHYCWALDIDWDTESSCTKLWYVSEEKLEPRIGQRFEESLESFEQPLAPGRDVFQLHKATRGVDQTVAAFLLRHPQHRHSVRRVQLMRTAPYAEVRDNTIDAAMMPIDLLRYKLAFFGATQFDPRSDRWLRICLYANAPYPEELSHQDADFWPYPHQTGAAV